MDKKHNRFQQAMKVPGTRSITPFWLDCLSTLFVAHLLFVVHLHLTGSSNQAGQMIKTFLRGGQELWFPLSLGAAVFLLVVFGLTPAAFRRGKPNLTLLYGVVLTYMLLVSLMPRMSD